MGGKLSIKQKLSEIKEYYNNYQKHSYFYNKQNLSVNQSQLNASIDFAILAKKQNYHSIRQIWKILHPLLLYLTNKQQKYPQIERKIKHNLQSLVSSAYSVLKMQDRFLQKVTPINISYFHFMRQSDFYFNYVAMKYILCVGNIRKKQKISVFDDLSQIQSVKMFKHIINWLYQIISYKCSAIYIQNQIVQKLIQVTFLVLCGLFGGQQNIILSIQKKDRQYIYNELFYIVVYICCRIKNKSIQNNFHLFQMGAITLCRVINSCDTVNISLYAPSFWYIDIFGLVKTPTVKQILLLLSFQIIQSSINYENQHQLIQQNSQQNQKIRTIIILFSHLIYQLITIYKTSSPRIIENYLRIILPNISLQSIARAYLTPILKMIQVGDSTLELYYKNNRKKSYCIKQKILPIQLVRKNWFQCERHFYFAYLYSAIQQKQLMISQISIWQLMVYFNEEYIKHVKDVQKQQITSSFDSKQEQQDRQKQQNEIIVNQSKQVIQSQS